MHRKKVFDSVRSNTSRSSIRVPDGAGVVTDPRARAPAESPRPDRSSGMRFSHRSRWSRTSASSSASFSSSSRSSRSHILASADVAAAAASVDGGGFPLRSSPARNWNSMAVRGFRGFGRCKVCATLDLGRFRWRSTVKRGRS